MAHASPNLTVSLTLPISCQICLGKVRQPVICENCHVFCSRCIELWLRKANHCPACRTPITSDNPCKEIIGATNENDCHDSSVKKKLRKTRFELLLRDYEDEIEALHQENEKLRVQNFSLETQLKIARDISPMPVTDENKDCDGIADDRRINTRILEDWKKKLEAATDAYKKVQLDIDKMKEANRTLRAQNVDLVRENLHLKAEVESRSPQKFGRYTVAALEAKIGRYERDLEHLRKALERSDTYIEELESKLSASTGSSDKTAANKNPDDVCHQNATGGHTKEGRTGPAYRGTEREAVVEAVHRGIGEMEQAVVCTNSEVESFSSPVGILLTTRIKQSEPARVHSERNITDSFTPKKQIQSSSVDPSITPSTSLRCLSLKSPGVRNEKNTHLKPLSYLRKLNFDDCSSSTSASITRNSNISKFSDHKALCMSSKPQFWEARSLKITSSSSASQSTKQMKFHDGEAAKVWFSQGLGDCEADCPQMSKACTEVAHSDIRPGSEILSSACENHRASAYSCDSTQCPDLDVPDSQEPYTPETPERKINAKALKVEEFHFAYTSEMSSESTQVSGTESVMANSSLEEMPYSQTDDITFIGPHNNDAVAPVMTEFFSSADQLHALYGMQTTSPCSSRSPDFQPAQGECCHLPESEIMGKTEAKIGESSKRKKHSGNGMESPSKMSKFM